MKKFIEDLLTEWSYRTREGYPIISNPDHIRVLSEILDEWGLDEIKTELIQGLLYEEEDEKRFKHSALNKTITYRNTDGEIEEGLVGNLMRRPPEEDAYIRAKSELDKLDNEDKQSAMDELGGEAQPDRDIEKERETSTDTDDEDTDTEDNGEETSSSDMFEPGTPSGDSYIDHLPDGDPAKEVAKETESIDEIIENVGYILSEASVWKYDIGKRFLPLKSTKSLFKKGLKTGEKVPEGPFTKESPTKDAIEVDLSGNEEVYISADDTQKTYKIKASKAVLKTMFGHMRGKDQTGKSINWNADTMETAACMGVFVNGFSILKQLKEDIKTDEDIHKVIKSIKPKITTAIASSGDYANVAEIQKKLDTMHLGDWYELARLMAGMTQFTDSIIKNWGTKYIIHNSIESYYKAIDKSELVDGTKQNTADMVISTVSPIELISALEGNIQVKYTKDGICYIPDTKIKWIQVSLKKEMEKAQLGKVYSYLKDKLGLLDNESVLNIALTEGFGDFLKRGADFIKNTGTKFLEKFKSLVNFVANIYNKINKQLTKPPIKELNILERELKRVGLKGSLTESIMLNESKSLYETLGEIAKNKQQFRILIENTNDKFKILSDLAGGNSIWINKFNQLKSKTKVDADLVGKILSNFQSASVLITLIGNVSSDTKQLYKNLIEIEKEMIYGKTTLPLYKVYGMKIDDTTSPYKLYPASEEYIKEKLSRMADDAVVVYIRVNEVSNYYSIISFALADIDENTGEFDYTQYRLGTNSSGKYSFNFEGVKHRSQSDVIKLVGA